METTSVLIWHQDYGLTDYTERMHYIRESFIFWLTYLDANDFQLI